MFILLYVYMTLNVHYMFALVENNISIVITIGIIITGKIQQITKE